MSFGQKRRSPKGRRRSGYSSDDSINNKSHLKAPFII
jgi:hypothetical protein